MALPLVHISSHRANLGSGSSSDYFLDMSLNLLYVIFLNILGDFVKGSFLGCVHVNKLTLDMVRCLLFSELLIVDLERLCGELVALEHLVENLD
jgi:hypothetical protein